MNYKELLKSKKFKIGVWGTGYIGLSTMVYFSKKKIKCVGYDVDEKKVKSINSGVIPLKDLQKWFGFDIKQLVKKNYLKATSNYNDLISEEFIAHFIAVPTEKNGKPKLVSLITSKAGVLWKSLSDDEKSSYVSKANENKQIYNNSKDFFKSNK